MRKILACLAGIALLCATAGCGVLRPGETTTTESITETTNEIITTEEPITTKPERVLIDFPQTKPMPEGYSWASFYATTPTHFYAVVSWKDSNWEGKLIRLPLSNISQQKEISLPEEHEGKVLSRPKICGVTPEWVFVCLAVEQPSSWGGWVVYRVLHETGKYEFVAECHSVAWYNAGSDSLLLPQSRGAERYLEALNLATGERSLIYEAEDFFFDEISDVWFNLEDGTITLYDCNLHIDAANQVKEDTKLNINASSRHKPKTEVEESLEKKREIVTYAPWNSWLYYVEQEKWEAPKNLYRMKPDGTGKELLRAGTRIKQLLSAGDKLFALAAYPRPDNDFGIDDVMLHELSADGKPFWNKPCRADSENSGIGMSLLNDMILVSQGIYGGGYGEHFVLLHDPATGQTLEGTR